MGKTALSVELAEHFKTEIISADSRQLYREMEIGTAVPTAEELNRAKHHFVSQRPLDETYSAGDFELDAIPLLEKLFEKHPVVVMVGGSGLYVKALTHGLDEHPSDIDIRNELIEHFKKEGVAYLQNKLKKLDPVTYGRIDLNNHQRIIRALEVSLATGKPYSSFLSHEPKLRNFKHIGIGLELPRAELFERINARVDQMVETGLIEEARKLYPLRHLNSLQTVGYKELFSAFDGDITIEEALESIKVNTRRFAKRQMTWFKKNGDARWFAPDDKTSIVKWINEQMVSITRQND